MTITTASLRDAIHRIRTSIEASYVALNELDGKVGDGDLGITLFKAFRRLDEIAADLPDDLGRALVTCGSEVSKVSSSSFGTLLATGLFAASKLVAGKSHADWSSISELLQSAQQAIAARGRSSLGDKTVLDTLAAAAAGAATRDDPSRILAAALSSVDATIAEFRDKPNRIGRARIFGNETMGRDDPGMIAFRIMLAALEKPAVAG